MLPTGLKVAELVTLWARDANYWTLPFKAIVALTVHHDNITHPSSPQESNPIKGWLST